MPEAFEVAMGETTELLETQNITSAPGDLPPSEIIARQATQRSQFRHDNTIKPLAPGPGQEVEVWATSGEELPLEQAVLFYTTDGSRPNSTSTSIVMERARFTWNMHAGHLTQWLARVPAQPAQTVVRYRIGGWLTRPGAERAGEPEVWAQDGQGVAFHFAGERAFTTFAYMVEEADRQCLPARAKNAVIYHIFLDRFRSDTTDGNFLSEGEPQELHGGTLKGVREALPYLVELGVTCLWLSPLQMAETYHRYDALDYFTVDPQLGTNADLKTLTEEAHALGIRVLLDFVPAHVSWHHPAFLAAQADPQAESRDWFSFEQWPDRYANFLDRVPSLPSFRSESEGARRHIIASAIQWLRDYDVDGFRLDHAIGMGMDFWTEFRRASREVQPEVFLVGEATDTPDALMRYRGKLDGILDFPLAGALRNTFGARAWDLRKFEHFLGAYEQYMAEGPGRVSFLDNHDMNRFLFVARDNVEQLQLAALCQFTLEPVPVIYYGTEVGMSQRVDVSAGLFGGDAEARQNMSWHREDWNADLLAFYQALVHLRTTQPILARGKRCVVHLDAEQQTYVYLRTHGTGQHMGTGDVLVLFNLSQDTQTLTLPGTLLPEEAVAVLATNSQPVIRRIQHQVEITLAPLCGAVFCSQETQRG